MMRKYIVFGLSLPILLVLLMLVTLLASCTLELNYDKYAVVYGISDYPGTGNDLNYTDDDARDFGDLLYAQGYQVILRVTDDGAVDADEATYNQLKTDLASVASLAGQNDLFVFFFSGHGYQQLSGSPDTTENGPGSDEYDELVVLVTDDLQATIYYTDDELAEDLQSIPCVKKVVIIDACNSGGFIANELEIDTIPPSLSEGSDSSLVERIAYAIDLYANFGDTTSDITPSLALVLAASGEREESYEAPPPVGNLYYHGVMTYFLLRSATAGDRNGDGYVTVTEVYDYIRKSIELEWNMSLSIIYNFLPHVSGGPIDYILFTK